jgi:hypothetical protein
MQVVSCDLSLGSTALGCPLQPVFISIECMSPFREHHVVRFVVVGLRVDEYVVEIEDDCLLALEQLRE